MVTVNELAKLTMDAAKKTLSIRHIDGPLGVRGRNSDNHLIKAKLGWKPTKPLRDGMTATYTWIRHCMQVEQKS
jgi:nucleoside-diphosphate-sugar epimerase